MRTQYLLSIFLLSSSFLFVRRRHNEDLLPFFRKVADERSPVASETSTWFFEGGSSKYDDKNLVVTLQKPPLTSSELEFHRGARLDHRNAPQPDGSEGGRRFFAEDEDDFKLEELLSAAAYIDDGTTYARRKPSTALKGQSDGGQWIEKCARCTESSQLEMGQREVLFPTRASFSFPPYSSWNKLPEEVKGHVEALREVWEKGTETAV